MTNIKKTIISTVFILGLANMVFTQPLVQKYNIPLNGSDSIFCCLDDYMQEYFIRCFDINSVGNYYLSCVDKTNQNYLYLFDSNMQFKQKIKLSISYHWMYIYEGDVLAIEKFTRFSNFLHHKERAIKVDSGILSSFLSSKEIIINAYCDKAKKNRYTIYSLPSLVKVGNANNKYNLPSVFQEYLDDQDVEYKGNVNDIHVFCKLELSDSLILNYRIMLVSNSGELIASNLLREADLFPDNLCTAMGCNIEMLRVLRNGKLYFLGADKKNKSIIVAEIKITDML